MYIDRIEISNLKRISSLRLAFPDPIHTLPKGKGRRAKTHVPWTVLIGENGTGKTAILQAIAMAAAGGRQLNGLLGKGVRHLVDRRQDGPMQVVATFRFPEGAWTRDEVFVGQGEPVPSRGDLRLASTLRLDVGEETVFGQSTYVRADGTPVRTDGDPLDQARSRGLPFWFVAAYGVGRVLPDASVRPSDLSQTDRLRPLFDASAALTSTNFANYFADSGDRTRQFAKVLRDVILPDEGPLLPELVGFTLQGYGGVTKATDITERHRFKQRLGADEYGIPAVALAHGYQSTIAWIADLVGHILLEAGGLVEPGQMAGLVLIDEIDLYIHPRLQVSLVRSLRRTFPRIQFVVTTHSPLILAALRPDEDEIVRLVIDPATGDAVRMDMKRGEPHEPDARTMTSSAIYQQYFGMLETFAAPEGQWLSEYITLACDPDRTDEDQQRLVELRRDLTAVGLPPEYPETRRRTR